MQIVIKETFSLSLLRRWNDRFHEERLKKYNVIRGGGGGVSLKFQIKVELENFKSNCQRGTFFKVLPRCRERTFRNFRNNENGEVKKE